MSSAALSNRYTPEEYLALERKAEYKSEYFNGFITAMSGASREHNLIAVNMTSDLNAQLRDRKCEVYSGDMRVLISSTGLYTYPDVSVVCSQPQFLDKEVDTLLNPTVVVEVLSPSTETYDRGAKFAHYRRIESLQDYVMISQEEMHVEHYTKQGNGWFLSVLENPEAILELPSIGCKVALSEIYRKVVFKEPIAVHDRIAHERGLSPH